MKAVICTQYGLEVLKIKEVKKPKDNEVLIR